MTISVGIAFAPQHGSSFMDLYRKADHALYQTKRAGKNGYSLYQWEESLTVRTFYVFFAGRDEKIGFVKADFM